MEISASDVHLHIEQISDIRWQISIKDGKCSIVVDFISKKKIIAVIQHNDLIDEINEP